MSVDLFVFAGEKSADIHGESLLCALKQKQPHLNIAGVGGPLMRKYLSKDVLKMEDFQVMGFTDVLFSLPSLVRHFYTVAKAILELNPKILLTIDYPGFNLRLARHLRKKGFKGKICHYICPSVWAWGKGRIPLMVENLDALLSVLPFEKQLFAHTSLPVTYVGNPLVEKIRAYPYKPFHLDKKTIALFPGSRKKEIQRNLPLYLQACKKLPEFSIAISISDKAYTPLIESIVRSEQMDLSQIHFIPSDYTYELMRACHLAFAKSGTVTLELALHQTPTVVTYGISPLDLFIAKTLLRIRLPFYSLANIIAQKEVFAELIGSHFTTQTLLSKTLALLNPSAYAQCKNRCEELSSLLSKKSSAQEAALVLLAM